jgi:S-DNA-T family DNA segregation ATPase FtsK/SpoIIIE
MTKTSQAYTRSTKPQAPPLPSRLVRLLTEARWLALATLLVYLALILLTYSRSDPGWSVANTVPHLHNWGGRVGAWMADLMLYIFGISAWWWCVLLAHAIWRSYRRMALRFLVTSKESEPEHHQEGLIRAIGFVFLLAGSLGIEYMRMYSLKVQMPRAPGGVLGEMIGSAVQTSLGFTGATLLLLLLFGLGFSLFFHVSWLATVERIGAAIEDSIFWVRNLYSARQDRKVGHVAAVKREEVVVQERAKSVEAAPIRIEPQVVAVPKSERIEKERQTSLFEDIDSGLPPLSLLDDAPPAQQTVSVETLEFTSRLIEKKLSDFGVEVKVVAAHPGPVITRYEIEPATGVKGSQIVGLARDLARSLSLTSIRVVEVIQGKNYMGLELPNPKRQIVRLTEILGSKVYNDSASSLTVALGKDIAGNPVVADLAKMPHLLVAGTTGSGKSVGINATILSLLYKSSPKQVRLILIDPKMLELSIYEGIPHLLAPVVTDMRQAGHALNWAVAEMERRYKRMSKLGVRNLAGYNQKIAEAEKRGEKIPNPFSLTPDAPEPLEQLETIGGCDHRPDQGQRANPHRLPGQQQDRFAHDSRSDGRGSAAGHG